MKNFTLVALTGLSLLSFSAHARAPKSVVINQAPVRALLVANVSASASRTKLTLTNKLDSSDIGAKKGVSPLAAKKARQALYGLENTGNGRGGGNYVLAMGAKKLLVSVGNSTNWRAGDGNTALQRFIARDGKSGIVLARGNIGGGQIQWTRMKNEHSKKTPAERNAKPLPTRLPAPIANAAS